MKKTGDMIESLHCSSTVSWISILVAASNAYMILHVHKSSRSQSDANFNKFKVLGISNTASAIAICFQAGINKGTPFPVLCLVSTATSVSFIFQLGFNISRAFEMLQRSKYVKEYYTTKSENGGVEEQLHLCVDAWYMILGISSSTLRLHLPAMLVFFIVNEPPVCNTINGVLSTIILCLSLFGMSVDVVWYFYMNGSYGRSMRN